MEKLFAAPDSDKEEDRLKNAIDEVIDDNKKHGLRVFESVQKLLHKVTLGLEINNDEAAELVTMQYNALLFTPFVPDVASGLEQLLSLRKTRRKWVERYKSAIRDNVRGIFPEKLSHRHLHLVASMYSDAMVFARGFSMSQGLTTLLGLMYQKHSPVPEDLDRDTATTVVWEALRLYPLVGAIPYLDLDKKMHVWPNIFLALWDERAWGDDAMEYRLRPLKLYKQKAGVAFGEMAVGRGCPGQGLAMATFIEFLLRWPRSHFKTDDDIVFTNTQQFYPSFELYSTGAQDHGSNSTVVEARHRLI